MPNEKDKILSFVGENFAVPQLSLLVVGTPKLCNNLASALNECQIEDSNLMFEVHKARNVKNLLNNNHCKFHIDFIIFVVDTRIMNALEVLRKDISSHIDSHFLSMSRVCFVASYEFSFQETSIHAYELRDFCTKLHAPLLMGKIMDEEKCPLLAQRVVNLVATVTGARTGTPLVLTRSKSDSNRLSISYATRSMLQN